MFYVSDILHAAPAVCATPLQREAYRALEQLDIPFERVETDEAITMEDCVLIEQKLEMKMVKTLLLCDRRQTSFYLFVTAGGKTFRAKEFSGALGVSRVSFAPAERMEELLGAKIGAATVFSALLDREKRLRVVFDREVAREEWYGCSDGVTSSYLKLRTQRVLRDLLPFAGHPASVIEV